MHHTLKLRCVKLLRVPHQLCNSQKQRREKENTDASTSTVVKSIETASTTSQATSGKSGRTLLIGNSILRKISTRGLRENITVQTNRGAQLLRIRRKIE